MPRKRENKMEENNAPKYSAIYARTSSPNQKYNYSIQEQVDQSWKFCEDREGRQPMFL